MPAGRVPSKATPPPWRNPGNKENTNSVCTSCDSVCGLYLCLFGLPTQLKLASILHNSAANHAAPVWLSASSLWPLPSPTLLSAIRFPAPIQPPHPPTPPVHPLHLLPQAGLCISIAVRLPQSEDSFLQYTYPGVLVLVLVRVLVGVILLVLFLFDDAVLSNPRFLPRKPLVVMMASPPRTSRAISFGDAFCTYDFENHAVSKSSMAVIAREYLPTNTCI